MTLEDFISRFNSEELTSALKQHNIVDTGSNIDNIERLASDIGGASEIVHLLSVVEEFRLREISLGLGVSGAGTMNQQKLKRKIALIILGEYETLVEGISKIDNLYPMVILVCSAFIGMILFIGAAFIFSSSPIFLSLTAMAIAVGFYAYCKLK